MSKVKWLVVAIAGVFIVLITTADFIGTNDRHERAEREQKQERLRKEFEENIARAKSVTGDPCTIAFRQNVLPPFGLNDTPRDIFMGQELPYYAADPNAFALISKDDHVELWADWDSETALAGPVKRKVAEKYWSDSDFCKSRRAAGGSPTLLAPPDH